MAFSRRQHRWRSGLSAFVAAAGLCLATPAAAADRLDTAAESPSAAPLILVDVNADMGDLKGGAIKFDIQRQALGAILGGNARMATYGGGACDGFSILKGGVFSALENVAPQGRRNLAVALDDALKTFPANAPVKRVVAIVGGPNQCLAALCAHAGRLKEQHPALVVDLIGFGLTDSAARRFDCVAANTGGRFARADAATLSTALSLTMRTPTTTLSALPAPMLPASALLSNPKLNEDSSGDGSAAALALLPESDAVIAQTELIPPRPLAGDWQMTGPEPFVPTGLRLSASLVRGGERLVGGARFELLQADKDGVYRLIARTERTATPLFAVPAGRYLARVSRGGAVSEAEVWAPEIGVVTRKISLDAGQLALAALSGGRPASRGAEFRVERLDGPGPILTISGRGRALATVPAGRYKVRATIDQAGAERIVAVRPGEIAAAGIDVPVGFVRVALAVTGPGKDVGPLAPAEISILRNGREIASAKGESPLFRLAPGPYTVIARSGRVEAERDVIAGAGALVSIAMTLDRSDVASFVQPADRSLIARQPSVIAKDNANR